MNYQKFKIVLFVLSQNQLALFYHVGIFVFVNHVLKIKNIKFVNVQNVDGMCFLFDLCIFNRIQLNNKKIKIRMGQHQATQSDGRTKGSIKEHKELKNGDSSLYQRLGGIYGIAAVVDHFSDNVLRNKKVGRNSPNPKLREWSRKQSPTRLPGLKWLRTLWVADITGGPYKFIPSSAQRMGQCPLSLENAHMELNISSDEFDEVARELKKTLDHFKVPDKEQQAVLQAFASHKVDITRSSAIKCPV